MVGFFSRLKEGLGRSTQKLTGGITAVFTKRQLDDAALDELEELLIAADLGPDAAARIIASFRASRFGREVTDAEVKAALAEEVAAALATLGYPTLDAWAGVENYEERLVDGGIDPVVLGKLREAVG